MTNPDQTIVDTLRDEHRDREWIDISGKRWRYSDHDGWVIRRKNKRPGSSYLATFGGWNPDQHGPFSHAPDE